MKKTAKLTTKGQVTVPRDIRRALGVQAGDHILFEGDAKGVRVRAVRTRSPFAKFQGIGNPGIASGRKAILKKIREMRGS